MINMIANMIVNMIANMIANIIANMIANMIANIIANMIANMIAHSVKEYKFIFWSRSLYKTIDLNSENVNNAVAHAHHTRTRHVPELHEALKRRKITTD